MPLIQVYGIFDLKSEFLILKTYLGNSLSFQVDIFTPENSAKSTSNRRSPMSLKEVGLCGIQFSKKNMVTLVNKLYVNGVIFRE